MFEEYITNNKPFAYYKITNGDTLYKVAQNYNVNPTLLAWLNGINETDYIYPNQVLIVPKSGTKMYITNIGDTLEDVLSKLNIDINTLIKENSKIYLQPEQLIVYTYK